MGIEHVAVDLNITVLEKIDFFTCNISANFNRRLKFVEIMVWFAIYIGTFEPECGANINRTVSNDLAIRCACCAYCHKCYLRRRLDLHMGDGSVGEIIVKRYHDNLHAGLFYKQAAKNEHAIYRYISEPGTDLHHNLTRRRKNREFSSRFLRVFDYWLSTNRALDRAQPYMDYDLCTIQFMHGDPRHWYVRYDQHNVERLIPYEVNHLRRLSATPLVQLYPTVMNGDSVVISQYSYRIRKFFAKGFRV